MARPIEPTPVLFGEDAERLLADLAKPCASDEEMQRRTAYAKAWLNELEHTGGSVAAADRAAEKQASRDPARTIVHWDRSGKL